MTTLGHSLTGLAALSLCMPSGFARQRRLLWAILFIALASIPDWPLPAWGHHQLAVSHSLWVNLLAAGLVAALLRAVPATASIRPRILICGLLAWMSHLLLDTLYGDLPGVAIYWPLSTATASLPVPWLNSLPHPPPPFDAVIVRILLLEALTFGPLVLLALWGRRRWPPSLAATRGPH